ncbi:ComEC/Rec2 family competence protein [Sphingomonas lenta]|uniref:Competence protein ComEC n=1 Tax=Sphingomonas lenta TaxID=1141887 RepID=A0A2A2SJC1_9SPHN|nr:ComEC/Rec2 family competence protein [Sphingomonas lenta]PAX09336.1 competence protein ComEC [Sphingomonas lenta]
MAEWHARVGVAVEQKLEAEREQLPLWLPVAVLAGIAAWFVLPDERSWGAALLALGAVACSGAAFARGGRLSVVLAGGALAMMIGLGLVWWRAERVAAPVLARPVIASFSGTVERVEPLPARELVRVTIAPAPDAGLPPRVRVNLGQVDAPAGLGRGAVVRMRARLMPPPEAALPGAYDYARVAWFDGVGATGRAFAPVEVLRAGEGGSRLRERLSRHVESRLEGSAGGIAAALATGDVGAITEEDAEAMRRAGLAHLLSVSGLHITAVVAATMLVTLRLLALSPWLALNLRLPLVAAGAGAVAAIGYTWLTGAQVPTIRSCVAALLVLAAIAMGREALTLRLVAVGALLVMLVWPESVAGPSFQLSFAAITAIVALHEHPRVRAWFGPHEEEWARRLGRSVASLLLTGIAVELALMPIAVFHFHKAGLYGALANIFAIPFTTFVVMPLEALALLLDGVGLGGPVWWLTGHAIAALLGLSRWIADLPGAVAALPAMPTESFALMTGGGLWVALWRTRWRRWGAAPVLAGAVWAIATPAPDLLVTGDGRHVALRLGDGRLAMLRDRTGDYVRDMLAENGGVDGEPLLLAEQAEAACNRDMCVAEVGGRRVAATRSAYLMPIDQVVALCRSVDIIVSERRLPRTCAPKWLKLDRPALERSGGVAVELAAGRVVTTRRPGDRHPWRTGRWRMLPPRSSPGRRAPSQL